MLRVFLGIGWSRDRRCFGYGSSPSLTRGRMPEPYLGAWLGAPPDDGNRNRLILPTEVVRRFV